MSKKQQIKIALVTGSTSGIGLAIAKQFIDDGYSVAINSANKESDVVHILTPLLQSAKNPVAYFQADLSQKNSGVKLVEAVIEKFGRIDILVNNAGVQKVAPVDELSIEDWDRVRTISLDASFQTIKAAIPNMVKNGFGRIINISSVHGLVASPYKSAYVAAKHALIGLTKTVALEVANKGISVNAICPGYVFTPLVEKQLKDQMKVHNLSEQQVIEEIMLANQPTRQFVQVEEIAALASYLSTDIARSITGAAITIDGGWTAR